MSQQQEHFFFKFTLHIKLNCPSRGMSAGEKSMPAAETAPDHNGGWSHWEAKAGPVLPLTGRPRDGLHWQSWALSVFFNFFFNN